jgi:hypothetical protein
MMLATMMGVALAGPTQQIDFDAVTVEGQRTGPSMELVTETTRDICPDTEGVDSPGWVECVVNLSYSDIKSLCSSMGPDVLPAVRTIMNQPERHTAFDRDVDGESMTWQGCFYNSRSGGRLETFVWHGTGSGWVVTNEANSYGHAEGATQTSLSVFDGFERSNGSYDDSAIELQATFAYLLRRTRNPGVWTAVPSQTNQDAINDAIRQAGYRPPYCGSRETGQDAERDCTALPRLSVVAVSPTMMAVQSFLPQKAGYAVAGIFWRSETGFDIARAQP